MRKLSVLSMLVTGLAAGFASGWIVAQAQNANKISPNEVLANNWVSDVTLLVRNGHDAELISAENTQSIVRSGLNIDSMVLGREYDSMPKALKSQILFYIPAAQAIVTAQQDSSPERNSSHLATFVNCMEKVKLQGGMVRNCVENAHE